MATTPFLLEIGLEELPARFVTEAIVQLEEKVQHWLADQKLTYERTERFSTPRRLAILVHGLADKQEDSVVKAKGPAKKIAQDEEGNWTKAALGFAKSQKIEPDALTIEAYNGVEYVYATSFSEGKHTVDILPQMESLITSLNFPKRMKWHTYDLRYARPIRWIVALFGEAVVPIALTDVTSGRTTRGHRFLGESSIDISSPNNYENQMLEHYVVVDAEKRKSAIRSQLAELEATNEWVIPVNEDLLEEVNNLIEYPTALSGGFEETYLTLPKEVLITTMREHQRYFPVESKTGELLPHFVTVRNGNEEHLENVSKGNEKVLRGRLADAAFFYEEDQKLSIDQWNQKLKNVVFHESIGTIAEKVSRTQELAIWLAEKEQVPVEQIEFVKRAATISKFDLVTNMVGEFPELQGRMGQDYAEKANEDNRVALAIREQYLPRFSHDTLPSSTIGGILSLADKIDTVLSCFAIGLIPTGSQDPYALRRQANGVVQILLDRKSATSIDTIIDYWVNTLSQKGFMTANVESTKEEAVQFFLSRFKHLMNEAGYRYDVVDAVLAAPLVDVYSMFAKAEAIGQQLNQPEFKKAVEALSRVTNLAQKAETDTIIDEALFENDVEAKLLAAIVEVEMSLAQAWTRHDAFAAYHLLAACQEPIHAFFEHTMVMVDDPAIRSNRLALLKRLARSIHSYADFQQIVFSS
ncbi:glycine--tRNA ligase subunit beta [Shouchella sp. JSM 1781072]|uniref:glycine--tRNA ligase subunit beta n=1 Tax=Shouchella sp. JSM 1781072 TaxID=3344581 RepID=UPI0035C1CBA5